MDGRGDPSQGFAPGRTSWTVVEEDTAPACSTNSRLHANSVCPAALTTCAKGLIRFWVWHQVTTFTRDAAGVTTSRVTKPWYQEGRTYCLGADDPGVPNIVKVIDQVRSEFASLPLRLQQPRSDPSPRTLVNIPTAFSAGSAAPQDFAPVLLGIAVHINAKPVRWVWSWGDGTSDAVDRPGTPGQPDVTHIFTRAGDLSAQVVVEWHGTFTVGGDATEYPIATPAFVRAPPVLIQVREARAQLVS